MAPHSFVGGGETSPCVTSPHEGDDSIKPELNCVHSTNLWTRAAISNTSFSTDFDTMSSTAELTYINSFKPPSCPEPNPPASVQNGPARPLNATVTPLRSAVDPKLGSLGLDSPSCQVSLGPGSFSFPASGPFWVQTYVHLGHNRTIWVLQKLKALKSLVLGGGLSPKWCPLGAHPLCNQIRQQVFCLKWPPRPGGFKSLLFWPLLTPQQVQKNTRAQSPH